MENKDLKALKDLIYSLLNKVKERFEKLSVNEKTMALYVGFFFFCALFTSGVFAPLVLTVAAYYLCKIKREI